MNSELVMQYEQGMHNIEFVNCEICGNIYPRKIYAGKTRKSKLNPRNPGVKTCGPKCARIKFERRHNIVN